MLLEQRKTLRRNMFPTCTSPKPTRSYSPAISEISVGSPSPPPTGQNFQITPLNTIRNPVGAFQPLLQVKRLRLLTNAELGSTPPTVNQRKSSIERVKSFTIADILGKKDAPDEETAKGNQSPPSVPPAPPQTTIPTTTLLSERLQPTLPPPNGLRPMLLEIPATALSKTILAPWDPTALCGPLPVRPIFSPAQLLHYEQRLAWDYQRQLQEHFQLQAQMLRQMSMDPNVIQSEDGSDRDSQSRNSTGSACCSPEVNVNSNDSISESVEKSTKDTSRSTHNLEGRKDVNCENISIDENKKFVPSDTPLDALFQLSTKNFDEEQDSTTLNIFATHPNPKKKRKSRTAFTNHQIFELEKRFLYQKYVSPADRDEIAAGLGLSNAQVITWFQNRRAKLKRDMEELKKDVESVKQLPDLSADIRRQLQQQQQQQQRQHPQQVPSFSITTHSQHARSWQHPPVIPTHMRERLPLTTTTPTTTATCGKPQINNGALSSIIIEDRRDKQDKQQDKQQLKLLKMMTLLHYGTKSG